MLNKYLHKHILTIMFLILICLIISACNKKIKMDDTITPDVILQTNTQTPKPTESVTPIVSPLPTNTNTPTPNPTSITVITPISKPNFSSLEAPSGRKESYIEKGFGRSNYSTVFKSYTATFLSTGDDLYFAYNGAYKDEKGSFGDGGEVTNYISSIYKLKTEKNVEGLSYLPSAGDDVFDKESSFEKKSDLELNYWNGYIYYFESKLKEDAISYAISSCSIKRLNLETSNVETIYTCNDLMKNLYVYNGDIYYAVVSEEDGKPMPNGTLVGIYRIKNGENIPELLPVYVRGSFWFMIEEDAILQADDYGVRLYDLNGENKREIYIKAGNVKADVESKYFNGQYMEGTYLIDGYVYTLFSEYDYFDKIMHLTLNKISVKTLEAEIVFKKQIKADDPYKFCITRSGVYGFSIYQSPPDGYSGFSIIVKLDFEGNMTELFRERGSTFDFFISDNYAIIMSAHYIGEIFKIIPLY